MECALVNKEEREGSNAPYYLRRRVGLTSQTGLGEGDRLTTSGSTEKVSSGESSESDAEVTTDVLSSSSCRVEKDSLGDDKRKIDPRLSSAIQEPLTARCLDCGEKIMTNETAKNYSFIYKTGIEISISMNLRTFQVTAFLAIMFLTIAILKICKHCFTCWTF